MEFITDKTAAVKD